MNVKVSYDNEIKIEASEDDFSASRHVEHEKNVPEMVKILVAEVRKYKETFKKNRIKEAELQKIADKALAELDAQS